MFDRDEEDQARMLVGPQVQVNDHGLLMFNPSAWEFMGGQYAVDAHPYEVVLLFDVETRTVAVQPVMARQEVPAGARWEVKQMRSREWPRAFTARRFVDLWQIGAGTYTAGLLRGPGPRLLTFYVGDPRPLPTTAAESPARGDVPADAPR
jgi:hypothetical protein